MARLNLKGEVYRLVKQIPKGKVVTYGQISNQLRIPKRIFDKSESENARLPAGQGELRINPRVVGWMLHANRSTDVPCHRVVDRNGRIAPNFAGPSKLQRSGSFGGAEEQRRRSISEGVRFKDKMHVDLAKCLWRENPKS